MENQEVEPGKVFVGGLSWETSKETLKQHFGQYGEVTDSVIMVDPATNKPRGFGFVTFGDPSLVASVCELVHNLDSKRIDPKPATSRTSSSNYSGRVKKIFIGGVSQSTTEEDIRSYFSQYGTVTDVELKYDRATQRMKGFGFVGFDSEDVVEKLSQARFHTIGGKSVEAKKAEPRQPGSSSTGGNAATGSFGGSNIGMQPSSAYRQQQSFSASNYSTPNYYNSGYAQQQNFPNYSPVGYNSGFGQPSYGSQQQGYTQQQGYGYENYGTARQGQEQVAAFGQDQATGYGGGTRATYTAAEYSQQTTPGYGYATPSATPYSNYQDQTTAVAYGRGQPQQRTAFAPPYRAQ